VPAPAARLHSDLADPPAVAAAAAAKQGVQGDAVAAQLRLLAQLVQRTDAALLGLAALVAPPARPAARRPGGGPLIEELPPDSQAADGQGSSPALEALLVALQYGPDACLARPWAAAGAGQAALLLLEALAAKLAEWQQLTGAAVDASLDPAAPEPGAGAGGGARGSGGSSPAAQRLLAAALAQVLPGLAPSLLAYAHRAASESARLEPYEGPDDWARRLAAGQLAWAVRQLRAPALGDHWAALVPLVLAAAEDPSPPVQFQGLWAPQHLAAAAPPADLAARAASLAAAAQRAVTGCDERAWAAAAAAGAAVAAALLRGSPSSPHAAALFAALLEEGERHSHAAPRAAVWLRAVPALFPAAGLPTLVRHLPRLAPLLLGWALGLHREVRPAALRALEGLVRAAWPRMPAHAAVIWGVVERTYEDEVRCTGRPAPGAAEAARGCARALWLCGGDAFREGLRRRAAGEGAGPGGAPTLLHLTVQEGQTSGV
jgi:hypothetical protein